MLVGTYTFLTSIGILPYTCIGCVLYIGIDLSCIDISIIHTIGCFFTTGVRIVLPEWGYSEPYIHNKVTINECKTRI